MVKVKEEEMLHKTKTINTITGGILAFLISTASLAEAKLGSEFLIGLSKVNLDASTKENSTWEKLINGKNLFTSKLSMHNTIDNFNYGGSLLVQSRNLSSITSILNDYKTLNKAKVEEHFVVDGGLNMGLYISNNRGLRFGPFAGVNYRIDTKVKQDSTFFTEKRSTIYIPFGFKAKAVFKNNAFLSVYGSANYVHYADYLKDEGSVVKILAYDMSTPNKLNYSLSLSLGRQLPPGDYGVDSFALNLSYQVWHLQENASESVAAFDTEEISLSLALSF